MEKSTKMIKKLNHLNIGELKKRLSGVYGVENQWAIVLNMYMEDYKKKFPKAPLLKTKVGREEFLYSICNTLVSGKIIGISPHGRYIFPILTLPENQLSKEILQNVNDAISNSTRTQKKSNSKSNLKPRGKGLR